MEVKWNLNGNWLLTASRDHLCKLFDIRNLREELQVFRGHKKEATAVAWHPVHEGLFASGGSDGSLLFWNVGVEKEVGGMEIAHEGMIWSLAWHPLGHILCSGSNDHTSKFWTRNRPGDKMRDRYNLNLLPGMTEDGVEYDDIEPNNLAVIPGMGIPEQLKMAMEQEQMTDKDEAGAVEMTIPGLDWGMEEVMQKDQKKVPQKKVPYAKPIPAQFQQAWMQNKVPLLPNSEAVPDRKEEAKSDEKKKNQAEIEQEMAALQYTNPHLLEQLKIERIAQKQAEAPGQPQGLQSPLGGPPLGPSGFQGPGPQLQQPQRFPQPSPSQQMQMNVPHGPAGQFIPQGSQVTPGSQAFIGPGPQGIRNQEMHPGVTRLPAPHGPMGPQGPSSNPGPQGQLGPQGPRPVQGMATHHPMQGAPGPQGPLMGVTPRGSQVPHGLRENPGPNQGMAVVHQTQDLRGPTGAMIAHGQEMRGPMEMRGPPDMRGPQDMRGPSDIRGPQEIRGPADMRGTNEMRGPQDIRGGPDIRGPQDIRVAPDMRGPQDLRVPPEMRGLQDMRGPPDICGHPDIRGPPDMRGPQDIRPPIDMRGPQDIRGPPDMRGPQEIRGPPDMRGPQDIRGPPDMRGPPDVRCPPEMRGPHDLRGPPEMRGPHDMRVPPEMRGPHDMRGPPDMRAPQDMRGPPDMRGPQDMRGPMDMRGPQDMRGDMRAPQDMRGISEVRGPQDMRGPPDMRLHQDMRVPQDMRGPHDMRGLPDMRGPQDIRGPPDMRGPQDMRGPPEMRGHPDMRGPQDIRAGPDLRGPPDVRGPPDMRGPHDGRGPPDMRGPHDMRGQPEIRSHPDMRGPPEMRQHQEIRGSDMRGPQDIRRPTDIRGSHDMRAPQNMRGISDIHGSQDIRTPPDIRGPVDIGGPHDLRGPQPGLSQGNSQGPPNQQTAPRASHPAQQKTALLGDGPRSFNQGGKGQVPPPLIPGLGSQQSSQGRGPQSHPGPSPNKGEIRGPPNLQLSSQQERRRELSPDLGPFLDGQEWGDSRDNRVPSDRRGALSQTHERPEDYPPEDRYGPRVREFDGRAGGPSPQDDKWRRGGATTQFPPNHRDFPDRDRDSNRWEGKRHSEERYTRDSEDMRLRSQRDEGFRRVGPQRREGRGSRGREGFSNPDEFGPEDNFDSKDEPLRGRVHGRGSQREGRKGLLPTPEQFSGAERGPNHQSRESVRETGPDHFPDSPRRDIPTPDGHSPASRERSASLQGMDMASLPPRKRPWHDGPGTPDPRDLDSSGGTPDETVKAVRESTSSRSQRPSRSSSQELEESSSRSTRGTGSWSRGGSGTSSSMNSSQSWRGGPRGSGSSGGGGRSR
ncbi:hypothetical protein GDO86_010232 [Hymenochirus boettgeri]|uniref:Pre-mRNA 3' end processing protein WDR33 n=1 Tax=Hymenochirus boettgeri TaxID=247094 RepID=A0A8T2JPM3_9PIPI|nr:hypothetical protein GDO86_010232 [Hymenochirus boettgeri]